MQILKLIIRNYSVPAVLCCMSIASVQSISRARGTYRLRRKWEELTEGCEVAFTTAYFLGTVSSKTLSTSSYQIGVSESVSGRSSYGKQTEGQGSVGKDHVRSCNTVLSETIDRNVELFPAKEGKKNPSHFPECVKPIKKLHKPKLGQMMSKVPI